MARLFQSAFAGRQEWMGNLNAFGVRIFHVIPWIVLSRLGSCDPRASHERNTKFERVSFSRPAVVQLPA